eukprot:8772546-Heterocapsa_arctica.AAC.1
MSEPQKHARQIGFLIGVGVREQGRQLRNETARRRTQTVPARLGPATGAGLPRPSRAMARDV